MLVLILIFQVVYLIVGDAMFKDLKKPKNKTIENSKKLYNYIYNNYPISKSKLKNISGFTLTTLNRAMDSLLNENLIYVSNIGDSNGGRKPSLYSINPSAAYIIGIDISRTYTKVTLMDLELNILKSNTFGMFSQNTPEYTLNKINDIISAFYKDFNKEKILGIGVGTVGPIDAKNGIILNPSNFPAFGWQNISITNYLKEKTGLIAILESGANAAVLGEHIKGSGKSTANVAYINLGVGIRLGIIHDNKIFNSANEGAFGHMTIDVDGKKCSCGKKGCLEAYVSIKSILDSFKESVINGDHSKLMEEIQYDLSQVNIDNFFNAVKNNDALAVKTINNAAKYLSVAIINLINILNSELIIIGGPLINKCDALYTCTVTETRKNLMGKRVNFSKGILNDDAIVIGAGSKVLNYYLK